MLFTAHSAVRSRFSSYTSMDDPKPLIFMSDSILSMGERSACHTIIPYHVQYLEMKGLRPYFGAIQLHGRPLQESVDRRSRDN